MQKINFENLPSTNTPIDAENLNLMQDNIEDAIDNISNNYIVEQGTSGEFTYRKWNNGDIELWGTHQFTGLNITTASAGTYYGDEPLLSIPLVISINYCFASERASLSSGTFIHACNISGTSLRFDIRRWQSGTNSSLGTNIYVMGRWK